MIIGLLITEFPNQTSISMWRVGNAMRELGHTVHIVSTRRSIGDDKCHKSLAEEADKCIYSWPPRFARCFLNLFIKPTHLIACAKYIFALKESSFVEKVKLFAFAFAGAGLAARLNQLKVEHVLVHSCANAAHLINFSYLCSGPKFSLRLGGDLEVYGKDQAAKFSNVSIAVPASLNNKQQIIEWGLCAESRILTSWLGVDTNRFKPNTKNDKVGPLKLITIARLNACKGHIYALEALKKVIDKGTQVNYVIAGSGPYETEIRQKIKELHLQKNVFLVGRVDEEQAIELLQASDVFVLPSVGIGEASPVALIEAMSVGLACISSVIGGTPEIITNNKDGILVEQKDVDGIAEAVQNLSQNPEQRSKMGELARESALMYFDCRSAAGAMLDAIEIVTKDAEAIINTYSPIERKMLNH